MTTPTLKMYSSPPLENYNDTEQRFQKKINVVNSFNNAIINIKEMITYFKDENLNRRRSTKTMKHSPQY